LLETTSTEFVQLTGKLESVIVKEIDFAVPAGVDVLAIEEIVGTGPVL